MSEGEGAEEIEREQENLCLLGLGLGLGLGSGCTGGPYVALEEGYEARKEWGGNQGFPPVDQL